MSIPTVNTDIFAKCAKLIEESNKSKDVWTQLRKEIQTTKESNGAGGDTSKYIQKIRKLEECNEDLEKKVSELESELAKKERHGGGLQKEREKLERDKQNMQKDAKALKEYNMNLEKAKATLEKREDEIRKREREMTDTMEFFQTQLAPTEKKQRPTERMPSVCEPSCRPDTFGRRTKRSRARISVVRSDDEDDRPFTRRKLDDESD